MGPAGPPGPPGPQGPPGSQGPSGIKQKRHDPCSDSQESSQRTQKHPRVERFVLRLQHFLACKRVPTLEGGSGCQIGELIAFSVQASGSGCQTYCGIAVIHL